MKYKIGLIGTGNVAWHLARNLENNGHSITTIYDRDLAKAKIFALDYFNAQITDDLGFSNSDASVFILAVSDDAIEELAQSIVLPPSAHLFHTSGTKPLKALGYANTENIGVFYPLQTFSKGKATNISEVPFCLEAETGNSRQVLTDLASSISDQIQFIDSNQRAVIHLSAVIACNFSNHMLSISKGVLEVNNMSFDLLKPLIAETINKALAIGPENAQTGPARRKDLKTLDKQLDSLDNDESVAKIYQTISQHILDYYSVHAHISNQIRFES